MPRKKKSAVETPSLLDITSKLRSGPCVPALREAVKSWQANGRKGITDTTRTLLNFWFQADHKLKTGRPFRYHESQQEAIETLIYVWEVEKIRTRKDLLEKYAQTLPTYAFRQTMASPAIAPRWRLAAAKPRSWPSPLPGNTSTPAASRTTSPKTTPRHFW
jgi:hypothetical protein